ncbi:MAG: ACT domain-containing protein [Lentisphaeria bacterium]|nr:ACT domain-containing protein [Lentisphaeria bacterium]
MNFIKQLSLFVENTPGSISKVSRVLSENNLSISTLSLADTSEFGILRLLIKESDAAAKVLAGAGFVVKTADVLALTVPNRAGGLSEIFDILDRHNLSVEYMYAFTAGKAEKAIIVFRFENPEEALAKISGEAVELISAEELFA